MKETQKLVIEGLRYTIYSYECHVERNLVTKELIMSLALSLSTKNITAISDWIMQRTDKKDITIERQLQKNDMAFKTFFYNFIGVRCTSYSEEYDAEREEIVLHFNGKFEKRIITNEEQEQKLTDLLS